MGRERFGKIDVITNIDLHIDGRRMDGWMDGSCRLSCVLLQGPSASTLMEGLVV